jgi:DNA-binding transcriptional ArsR family regulator
MPPRQPGTCRADLPLSGPSGYVGPVSTNAERGVEQAVPMDAAVMRAMAHPARLALLEHLRNNGPATATECAGVVGLSPSATSYHLRALARAGLVEAAPGRGDGRERLWRIIAKRLGVSGVADLDPEVREALRGLMESLLAWDDARVRRYLAQLDTEPPEWQDAAFFMDSTLQVTAAELTEVSQAVYELLEPYRKDRRGDLRPGTRTVSIAVRALPS